MNSARHHLKKAVKHSILFTSIVLAASFIACSVEKDTMTSKAYHNTLARYNGYFIAKETIKEVETKVNEGSPDNFNRVLKVYPTVTPAIVGSINADLEEIIKKASLPIQRHKNSRWVDNSYTLIGRARYYKMDYDNASITFKYVNSKGEDDNDRHEALTWLLRTFTQTQQYDNALSVVSYLSKQELTDKNKELFSLAKAELYQTIEEQNSFLKSMNEAEEVVKNRSNQARVHFILGQVNQQEGNNADAYAHYKKSIRKSPTYEMAFYGKLYMTQVTDLKKKSYKQVMKYYRKLLRDEKNVEYKDKIYYEMAQFEYKLDKMPESLENLRSSLRENKGNAYQKAYSYLMMSEIYYEDLKNYRQASYYYDSTYAILDKNEKVYPEVKKRATILKEFVKQLDIIQREDSLQALARMDTAELRVFLNKQILDEEKKELEELERKEKALQNQQNTSATNNNLNLLNNALGSAGSNASWYFYNPITVDQGKTAFRQKWGERDLEDNWRRSNKEKVAQEEEEEEEGESTADAKDGATTSTPKEKEAARLAKKRKQRMKDIPFSPADLEASNKRIEEALYIVAGIYHLKLEEPQNGSDTYEELIKRFPEFEDITEVYYTLYIINKEMNPPKAEYYKNILLNQYPNSVYAKLILDPQYLIKNEQINKMAQGQYAIAYELHKQEYYDSSFAYCDKIIAEFPDNDIMDRIVFLKALNIGLQDTTVLVFKQMLEKFIVDFSSSELIPLANEYLKGVNDYMLKRISSTPDVAVPDVQFVKDKKAKHLFVTVFEKGNVKKHMVLNKFAQYNDANWASYALKPTQQLFDQDRFLIQVTTFEDAEKAMNYYNTTNVGTQILQGIAQVDFNSFVISEENYTTFYKGKYLQEYMSFFRENYILDDTKGK